MITEEDKKEMQEWVKNAIELKLTKKDIIKKFKTYPSEVRKFVFRTFKIMLKGGNETMPKKIEYEEEDLEDEDNSEDDEVPTPIISKREVKEVPKQQPVQTSWFVDYSPEKFRVIDPLKKKIIIESNSAADLSIQLQVKILQRLTERL